MSSSRYQDLVAKVDAKAQEFQERYAQKLQCRKGCSSCCQPHLTVFSVERLAIRDWLLQRPALIEKLKNQPENPGSCRFLDDQGACQIYPVRPIICRTQGLPLSFKVNEQTQRDVCPLNFEKDDVLALPTDGVLNLDLLNTLLVLVDQVEGGDRAGQRFALNIEEVIRT
ncbi:YkgJ family cysteine cluster protein [Oligoflexus tunisiensis]|uniref:YkgJ family cysteine cluster protein n=1 Tax=Oligoflexus tunisiensis TaxID=708132 RepID=UPI00114CD58E|nr:YkgJ family cysteine cluster protein [Oligoflexus tunisiensis]